jgi:polypeptide N-acetylgalactosaminyltransferase
MSVPIIDGIDHDTFEYKPVYNSDSHPRGNFRPETLNVALLIRVSIVGIFEWGMLYKESEVPESVLNSRRHPSEPYSSPTHAGGEGSYL